MWFILWLVPQEGKMKEMIYIYVLIA